MQTDFKRAMLVLTLSLAWLAIPVICSIAYDWLQASRAVQDSPRCYVAMALSAVFWLTLTRVLMVAVGLRFTREIVGLCYCGQCSVA